MKSILSAIFLSAATVVTLSNGEPALADVPAAGDTSGFEDDSESGVICIARAVTSKGITYVYQLYGAGEILEDGTLVWAGGIRFNVLQERPGKARVFLLKGVTPLDNDCGMGHVYYTMPGSVHGINLDVSRWGHSIALEHKVDAKETVSAAAECVMVD